MRLAEEIFGESKGVEALSSLELAYYRAGQWDKAAASLQHLSDNEPSAAWQVWPALALVHHKQGHAEEARRYLDKAAAWRTQARQRLEAEAPGRPPESEWPDFEILYTQAAGV